MFKFKAVKPKQFKADAFRVELLAGAREFSEDLQEEFEPLTEDWEGDAPEYPTQIEFAGGEISVDILVSGSELAVNKFFWNNDGTPPHPIRAKNAKVLAFTVNGTEVFTPSVAHPGTAAKGWTKAIAARMRPQFRSRMQAALRRAAARSGHGRQ